MVCVWAFSNYFPLYPFDIMITDLILVRHGETSYNRDHIIQGWLDIPLNENGICQAERTAEILRDESIDEIWHSDLQRAADTAHAIRKYHPDVPLYPYPQVREWKLGILQDRSYPELERDFPEYVRMLQNESVELSIPGGESRKEFQERVNQAFQELAERSPGKSLLVVTHGGVLVRFYRFLGGEVPASGKITGPGNASVTRARYDHETKEWTMLAWNQIYSPQAENYKAPPAL